MNYAPLTPELRQRIAQGAARRLLRRLDGVGRPADAAVEGALAAAPNAKAIARVAERLRSVRGIASATPSRSGSMFLLACRDRYVAEVDRARPGPDGRSVNIFETTVLAYRTSHLAWRKRCVPVRHTEGVVYFDAHSIARLIERGPFDPRDTPAKDLVATLDAAHLALRRALLEVEAAEKDGRLSPDLASVFPVPCPRTGGLWIVESSTSGDESSDATVVTYVGPRELQSEQHNFMTACDDGDFIAALTAYPEALPRHEASPEVSARLAALSRRPAGTA